MGKSRTGWIHVYGDSGDQMLKQEHLSFKKFVIWTTFILYCNSLYYGTKS